MNRPSHKTEGVNHTKTMWFYPFVFTGEERNEETCYGYCNEYQPHAVKRMFDYKNGMLYDMRWDEAGNLGQVSMAKPGEMFEAGRFLFWTEDCCGPRPCERTACTPPWTTDTTATIPTTTVAGVAQVESRAKLA